MANKPFLQAIRRQSPGQVPVWLMRQAGRYLPEYRALRAEAGSFLNLCYRPDLAAEVTLQPIRRFGFDAAILFADILLLPHAIGVGLEFREGEGPVLEPVRSRTRLAELRPDNLHKGLAPVYETVARLKAALPAECALIGFAGAPWTVATYMVAGQGGDEQAAAKAWAYADPEGFGELIALLERTTVEYLARQIDAGAEAVQIFDTWAGSLPEDGFRRWSLQPIQRIAQALKARYPKVPVIAFPRGAGFGYSLFEGVDALSLDPGVPLAFARQTLQDRMAVQGNLDPRYVVIGGDAMRQAAERILAGLAKGPFVFNLGHGIVPETPPEHVAELVRIVHGWKA